MELGGWLLCTFGTGRDTRSHVFAIKNPAAALAGLGALGMLGLSWGEPYLEGGVGKGGEDTRANSCLYLEGADYNMTICVILFICHDVNVILDSHSHNDGCCVYLVRVGDKTAAEKMFGLAFRLTASGQLV